MGIILIWDQLLIKNAIFFAEIPPKWEKNSHRSSYTYIVLKFEKFRKATQSAIMRAKLSYSNTVSPGSVDLTLTHLLSAAD